MLKTTWEKDSCLVLAAEYRKKLQNLLKKSTLELSGIVPSGRNKPPYH
jgi:hypothetical protein